MEVIRELYDSLYRHFDQSYQEESLFGVIPHTNAKSILEKLSKTEPSGRILDLACGSERHTFYAARLGLFIDAVDISVYGLQNTSRRLKEERIKEFLNRIQNATKPTGMHHITLFIDIRIDNHAPSNRFLITLKEGEILLKNTYKNAGWKIEIIIDEVNKILRKNNKHYTAQRIILHVNKA